jgi:hypothetical protein
MSNAQSQQFHLVVDFPPGEAGRSRARVEPLPVPAEPATVITAPGVPPRLMTGNHPLAGGAIVVEQIVNKRRQLRLLTIHRRGEPLRVNGQLAPRVALLGEKDSLQLSSDTTLHVTLFNRPRNGKSPPELIGKQCPVCRVPFTENSMVYICPCGVALHNSADGDPDGLQCTRLQHACIGCERPITLKEGFTYWPDLIHA